MEKGPKTSIEIVIEHKAGMHARPSAAFVKKSEKYKSEVLVEINGKSVSGKDILGLMTMEIKGGDKIKITAQGEDSDMAIIGLKNLIEHDFYMEH